MRIRLGITSIVCFALLVGSGCHEEENTKSSKYIVRIGNILGSEYYYCERYESHLGGDRWKLYDKNNNLIVEIHKPPKCYVIVTVNTSKEKP